LRAERWLLVDVSAARNPWFFGVVWLATDPRCTVGQAKLAHGVVTPPKGQKRRHLAAVPEDFSPIAKNTGAIF